MEGVEVVSIYYYPDTFDHSFLISPFVTFSRIQSQSCHTHRTDKFSSKFPKEMEALKWIILQFPGPPSLSCGNSTTCTQIRNL